MLRNLLLLATTLLFSVTCLGSFSAQASASGDQTFLSSDADTGFWCLADHSDSSDPELPLLFSFSLHTPDYSQGKQPGSQDGRCQQLAFNLHNRDPPRL
ncbi:MAG: hypothetical protein CML06_10990 [Pseudomonadales bacterium]|nr:hypothetical protein [Pseudomonadales bacterium]